MRHRLQHCFLFFLCFFSSPVSLYYIHAFAHKVIYSIIRFGYLPASWGDYRESVPTHVTTFGRRHTTRPFFHSISRVGHAWMIIESW
ncbi:hypothetical protein F4823DRAFT_609482 [Ustulina deusta]|nr:hypothetical protein F4823DRAFT_609482 [Ustulina deusta]